MALMFQTGMGLMVMLFAAVLRVQGATTHLVDEPPVAISVVDGDVVLVDFGRVAFGNVRLMPPAGAEGSVVVHFGESMVDGRISRKPPGTVR